MFIQIQKVQRKIFDLPKITWWALILYCFDKVGLAVFSLWALPVRTSWLSVWARVQNTEQNAGAIAGGAIAGAVVGVVVIAFIAVFVVVFIKNKKSERSGPCKASEGERTKLSCACDIACMHRYVCVFECMCGALDCFQTTQRISTVLTRWTVTTTPEITSCDYINGKWITLSIQIDPRSIAMVSPYRTLNYWKCVFCWQNGLFWSSFCFSVKLFEGSRQTRVNQSIDTYNHIRGFLYPKIIFILELPSSISKHKITNMRWHHVVHFSHNRGIPRSPGRKGLQTPLDLYHMSRLLCIHVCRLGH